MAHASTTSIEKLFYATSILVLACVVASQKASPPCLKEPVARLVRSEFRTVVVETTSGKIVPLYSPTVAPGDMVCVDR